MPKALPYPGVLPRWVLIKLPAFPTGRAHSPAFPPRGTVWLPCTVSLVSSLHPADPCLQNELEVCDLLVERGWGVRPGLSLQILFNVA